MHKNVVNLAFFGTGDHATASLYPCIPQIPDTKITAVFSRKRQRALATAQRFGIQRVYDSIPEILRNEAIDGAVVVGPPQLHATVAIQCFEKGIPVFIEKPPALDTPTTKELLETARRNNTFGMVGFNKRYALAYRMAKKLMQEDSFGSITMMDVKFSNGPWPPFWGIRERAISFLIGQAIHMFDLVRFFAGDFESVFSLFSRRSEDRFGFAVQAKLRNHALVTMNMTCYEGWNTFNEHVSITGEGNFIVVENGLHLKYHPEREWVRVPDAEIYNLYHGWDVSGPMPRTTNFSHEHLGYLGELRAFVNAVRTGTTPHPTLEDGLQAMRICDAVWKSATAGCIVTAEETDM